MATLKSVLSKKKVLKTSITKLRDKIESKDIVELKFLLNKCDEFVKELKEIFSSIFECDHTDAEEDKFVNEQQAIRESIDDLVLIIQRKINELKLCDSHNVVAKADVSDSVKLPKLSIPTFSGNIHEWLAFNDLFKASIHNSSLSDGQKLQYLKSALKGDALRIVQSLTISDQNYSVAWSLLEDRYSNNREQVFAHIKRFMSIPAVQNESPSALLSLVDTTFECVRSLEILEQKVDGFGDTMFAYILLQKLDSSTKLWFEREFSRKKEIPKLDELIQFLKNYARTLQASKVSSKVSNQKVYPKSTTLLTNLKATKCVFCNSNNHVIFKCTKFQELSVNNRVEFIKNQKLCFNCFGNHGVKNCTSRFSCVKCGKKHNTLIHFEKEIKNSVSSAIPQQTFDSSSGIEISNQLNPRAKSFETNKMNGVENPNFAGTSYKQKGEYCATPNETNSCLHFVDTKVYTFLSTAVVNVRAQNGEKIKIRALLDGGSQVNFVRKEIAELLGLKQQSISAPISGLSNTILTVKRKISALIENSDGEFKKNIDLLIVNKITDLTPRKPLDISKICFPQNIIYADQNFCRPGKIDALLGAEIFYQLLKPNQINLKNESVMLQETVFGWVVTGSIKLIKQDSYHCGLVSEFEDVNNQIKKFWELEAIGIKDDGTGDGEDKAQEIFNKTVCFENGRYVVSLPWKKNWEELDHNFSVAKKRLESLNKRMKFDESLHSEYCEILNNYLNEGIIEQVLDPAKPVNKPLFYLPHQVVIKRESLTTKVRIVFDASAHDVGQLSLNDCLYQGVNLNPNIFQLLIYFRLNKIAFVADIEKAFLQISLSEKDRDAVRFLFVDEMGNIQVYKFKRVIFGVNASPFLLAATIKKHIEKYREEFPITVEVLDTCFYVDDLIAGEDDVLSAFELSQTAEKIMKDAGMCLRKWISNDKDLMKKWEAKSFNQLNLEDLRNKLHRVLGVSWDPGNDYITIEINSLLEFLKQRKNTKRYLLMAAGRIFDPIGLVTPFTIRFKCLFQEIWQKEIGWDEELPPDIGEKWMQWCKEVPQLKGLKIPRCIINFFDDDRCENFEIHTFSDASAKAYGAVVYVKAKINGRASINLVASKSRVAPLKKMTLPRLELMGALLAARLASEVKKVVDRKHQSTSFFWTDSQITLYWIQSSSKRWKPFVANRVKEIQSLTSQSSWRHCPGKDNPADLLTRGVSVDILLNNPRWWTGSDFLKEEIPNNCVEQIVAEEQYHTELKRDFSCENSECLMTLSATKHDNIVNKLLNLSNNFLYVLCVLSYIFRFCYNLRNPNNKKVGPLTAAELNQAETFFVKKVQSEEFPLELKCLLKGKAIAPSSKLKSLAPFLDKQGIIRVGGRLQNSDLDFFQKHPMLLPSKSRLTLLIVMYLHRKCFHVGPQGLLYQVREKYWPINARNLCRKICHECVICFKANPTTSDQLMGNLPPERVNQNFVFNVTGIDFCGPFFVKYKNQRKGVFNKVYVAIFICLTTRAIHLEIVTDLTTQAFIASLKRFFSRRGKSQKLFTDNAKTFIGANAELKRLLNMVRFPDEVLAGYLSSEGVDWKFIPPKAPNFGGLWEAGVKSFKNHFKRVVGDSKLTLEEFLTVIVQIEGFLNSRPISPMSSDPNDFQVLSPGHFLTGRQINSIVEPSLCDVPENRLSQWQKITKHTQMIWKLWRQDYLNNLQQRSKWLYQKENVKIGTVVLIKEENLPPTKWLIARIIEIFTGKDGKVRVVKLQLPDGNHLKRSVRHICILPNQ